jgi:outer membrane receptor protein involved in Fe transport
MHRIKTPVAAAVRAFVPALLLLLLAASAGFGQERFGELRGEATDATGAVLPNVTVTATNQETKRAFTTTTSGNGAYIIREIDPGRYTVGFELTGFTKYVVPDVILTVGRSLTVNAKMTVGGTEQTVQVTEAAPLIDITRTLIANNITAEEIDKLPKGRSFQSLVLTTPSVNSGDIEGGFQVNGASGAENQFNIDGISTTSLVNGKSRQNAMFEILQEVQIKTTGLDAEFGGALGGVVSAITKSGGNEFHGDVHYYYGGNKISAGPVQRLLLDPRTERTASFVQDTDFPENSHEIGYTLGGYLIKNRVYFFSAASPRFRNRDDWQYTFADGRQDTLFNDRTDHMVFNKLSFDLTSKLRGNINWLWTPVKSQGSLPTYNSFANTVTSSFEAGQVRKQLGSFNPQSSYTGQIDYNMTPTSLVQVRGGRFWDNYKFTGVPDVSAIEYRTSATALPFAIPANLQQPAGYATTPRFQATSYDLVSRTFVQVDASKFLTWMGQHNIKGGWGFTKTVNKIDEYYPGGGFVTVYWNTAFNSPTLGRGLRGEYGYYTVDDLGTRGSTGGQMHGLYIQDQWRIIPRLTLSLGLRVENERVPSFDRARQDYAFQFGFGDKIAPRLGASFDLFGNGRVKLFGSWGRYFDWVKYELSRGSFGGDFWTTAYRSLDTLDILSLSGTNMPGRNLWSNVPGSTQDHRSDVLVDPNLKPMSQDNFNFGGEFQLGERSVLRVSYIGTRLRRTIEDLGTLDELGSEIYTYGNPGESLAEIQPAWNDATGTFPMPKAKRRYDAMELSLTRRFSRGFFFSGSYVMSRLYGNYAGIAASDEITSPSTGLVSAGSQGTSGVSREGGNANRYWDLAPIYFDSHGEIFYGRLPTDRPHSFKLYGSKEFSYGANATTIGLFWLGQSGTPLSTQVYDIFRIPYYVEGRGDMGRTPFLTQTDINLQHDIKIGEVKRIRFEFNALNVFNQKIARGRFQWLNRGMGGAQSGSAINLLNVNLHEGYDYRAMLAQTTDQLSGRGAYDPRFGLDDLFNTGFQGRFGVKFIF